MKRGPSVNPAGPLYFGVKRSPNVDGPLCYEVQLDYDVCGSRVEAIQTLYGLAGGCASPSTTVSEKARTLGNTTIATITGLSIVKLRESGDPNTLR